MRRDGSRKQITHLHFKLSVVLSFTKLTLTNKKASKTEEEEEKARQRLNTKATSLKKTY